MRGFVYFAQAEDTGFVKIGFSTRPYRRVKSLGRDMVPLGAMPGSRIEEGRMHLRWAHCRLFGEWFQPSSDLLMFAGDLGTAPFQRPMERKYITATKYAEAIDKDRAVVMRWLKAAKLGDVLLGGGIAAEDTEGRRWIEVADPPKPAPAPAPTGAVE